MDKIFNLAVIANMIANVVKMERTLPRVAFVMAIAAVLTLLSGLILIVGFYALYVVLGYHMDPEYAALITAGAIFATAAAFVAIAAYQVEKIKRVWHQPAQAVHHAIPPILSHIGALSNVGSIVDSFIAGLTAPRPPQRRPLRD